MSAPSIGSAPPPFELKRVGSARERILQHRSGVSDVQHTTTHYNEGGKTNVRLAQMMWPEERTQALLQFSPMKRAQTIQAMTGSERSNAFVAMSKEEVAAVFSGMSPDDREATLARMSSDQKDRLAAAEAQA